MLKSSELKTDFKPMEVDDEYHYLLNIPSSGNFFLACKS